MWWTVALIVSLGSFFALAIKNRRLALLLLLALLPAYLWRTQVAGIPTTWLELAIYLTVIAHLFRDQASLKYTLTATKQPVWLIPIALMLTAAIGGVLIATDARVALGILKGWFIDPFLVALLIYHYSRTGLPEIWWRQCWGALLIGAAATVIISLVGLDFHPWQRLRGWYDSPNVFAMYLTPIWVGSLFWPWHTKLVPRLSQAGWLSALTVVGIGIIFTQSYTALIALGFSLLLAWYLKTSQTKRGVATWVLVGLSVIGLGLPFAVVARGEWTLPTRWNESGNLSSGEVRLILWQHATTYIREQPLLGLGLGQWQNNFLQRARTNHLLSSVKPELALELYYSSLFPHSLWLTTWLSLGLLGLGSLIWLSVLLGRAADRASPKLGATLAGVTAVMLIQGTSDTTLFKNDLSILWWFVLALALATTLPTLSQNRIAGKL